MGLTLFLSAIIFLLNRRIMIKSVNETGMTMARIVSSIFESVGLLLVLKELAVLSGFVPVVGMGRLEVVVTSAKPPVDSGASK